MVNNIQRILYDGPDMCTTYTQQVEQRLRKALLTTLCRTSFLLQTHSFFPINT